MQKEPHGRLDAGFPQVMRRQHQVIIMNPHEIVIANVIQNRLRKLPVHSLVDLPVVRIEIASARQS